MYMHVLYVHPSLLDVVAGSLLVYSSLFYKIVIQNTADITLPSIRAILVFVLTQLLVYSVTTAVPFNTVDLH